MKSFVKNRAASEGCIAECYVGDEVVSFVERYYGQTMRNERLPRVDDNSNHISSNTLFPAIGKPVGAAQFHRLSPVEMLQTHRHVLCSTTVVHSQFRSSSAIGQTLEGKEARTLTFSASPQ